MTDKYAYGWKFLTPYGTTEYDDQLFCYNLPLADEKYGAPTSHPDALKTFDTDNNCGPGRLHLMNKLDARYAPKGAWWPWFARYKTPDLVSKSDEKVGVTSLELRRVTKRAFWRMIRLGWCSAANLRDADLRDANLRHANLWDADLWHANLWDARYNEYTRWPEGYEVPANALTEG